MNEAHCGLPSPRGRAHRLLGISIIGAIADPRPGDLLLLDWLHRRPTGGCTVSRAEGYVVVSYSVSASGAVSNVSVVSASPPGIFNAATLAAVRQWRFKPSPQGAHGRRTTVRFKLK